MQPKAPYFQEGEGFVFVRMLGAGSHASARLVRSLLNDSFRRQHTRAIPGAVACYGWFRYQPSDSESSDTNPYYVSYWKYGNAADLAHYYDAPSCDFPKKWLGQWLISMLKTVLDFHEKGIAHSDAHHANWFVHQQNPDSAPEIFLGDYDTCRILPKPQLEEGDGSGSYPTPVMRMAEHQGRSWEELAAIDFQEVCTVMSEVLGHDDPYMAELHGFLDEVRMAATASRMSKLETLIQSIVRKIEAYESTLAAPKSPQDLVKAATIRSISGQIAPTSPHFSSWKLAVINHGVATNLSTPENLVGEELYMCENGEWY